MDDVVFWRDPWTDAEVEHLKAGYLKVATVELALDLKRTPQAVRSKANALGLRRPPPKWKRPRRALSDIHKAQEERALAYMGELARGLSAREVGAIHGVSRNVVIGVVNRYRKRICRCGP